VSFRRPSLLATAILATALLAACATPATRVVLLPQPDGKASAVVVGTEDGEETLARPYLRATAKAGARGAPVVDEVDPLQLLAENKSLFDMLPPPVQHYTVFFEAGGTELTASSQVVMKEAMAAALARGGGEIVVTGHTDAVGSTASNDELSLSRAQLVQQLLLHENFPATRIEAVGRGERELAVQTPNETDEARNRRVTIEVR
jgi:OOP family OmpA-OmpF porin